MRAIASTLVAAVLLVGCSGRASPAASPGIVATPPAIPEHRSTCEALARADLAGIATDAARLARIARALDDASARAPADVQPELEALAAADRSAAGAPAIDDRSRAHVVGWFTTRCGGIR